MALNNLWEGGATNAIPKVQTSPLQQTTQPTVAPQQPKGVPTWMDLYHEYTNQDWFKNMQKDYGGQIDRRWNADDGTRRAKQAIDDLYITRLGEYNKANGTNFAPDQSMLGADAQPNDWNHKQNSNGGFLADTLSHWGNVAATDPLLQTAITVGGAAMGIPTWMTATGLGVNRAGQDGDIGAGLRLGGMSYLGGEATNAGLGNQSIFGGSTAAAPALSETTGAVSSPVTQGVVQGTALPPLDAGLSMNMPLATGGELGAGGVLSTGAGAGTAAGASTGNAGVNFLSSLAGGSPASGGSSALSIFGNAPMQFDAGTFGKQLISNLPAIGQTLGGLYSSNEAGKANARYTDAIQNQMQTLKDMFSQDSPYAKMLRQQLERKDAAAGRNSQYGNRETQLQALLAEKALTASDTIGRLAGSGANLEGVNNDMRNQQLNLLGNLFKQAGLEDAAKQGAQSAWDWAKGGLSSLFS